HLYVSPLVTSPTRILISPYPFFFLTIRLPPSSTLFPYTTLFRSDIVRKRAEPALFTLGRRPSRPLFLASDRGHAGPGLTIFAYDCAIADRPAFRQHVVNEASIGIDQDRPWRFVAVVWDDLTLIGGWDRRLPIRRVRQLLLIPRSEICVRHRRRACMHASAEQ